MTVIGRTLRHLGQVFDDDEARKKRNTYKDANDSSFGLSDQTGRDWYGDPERYQYSGDYRDKKRTSKQMYMRELALNKRRNNLFYYEDERETTKIPEAYFGSEPPDPRRGPYQNQMYYDYGTKAGNEFREGHHKMHSNPHWEVEQEYNNITQRGFADSSLWSDNIHEELGINWDTEYGDHTDTASPDPAELAAHPYHQYPWGEGPYGSAMAIQQNRSSWTYPDEPDLQTGAFSLRETKANTFSDIDYWQNEEIDLQPELQDRIRYGEEMANWKGRAMGEFGEPEYSPHNPHYQEHKYYVPYNAPKGNLPPELSRSHMMYSQGFKYDPLEAVLRQKHALTKFPESFKEDLMDSEETKAPNASFYAPLSAKRLHSDPRVKLEMPPTNPAIKDPLYYHEMQHELDPGRRRAIDLKWKEHIDTYQAQDSDQKGSAYERAMTNYHVQGEQRIKESMQLKDKFFDMVKRMWTEKYLLPTQHAQMGFFTPVVDFFRSLVPAPQQPILIHGSMRVMDLFNTPTVQLNPEMDRPLALAYTFGNFLWARWGSGSYALSVLFAVTWASLHPTSQPYQSKENHQPKQQFLEDSLMGGYLLGTTAATAMMARGVWRGRILPTVLGGMMWITMATHAIDTQNMLQRRRKMLDAPEQIRREIVEQYGTSNFASSFENPNPDAYQAFNSAVQKSMNQMRQRE